MTKPDPYCPECDEPLNWCVHGDGDGWAAADVPEIRPDPDIIRGIERVTDETYNPVTGEWKAAE